MALIAVTVLPQLAVIYLPAMNRIFKTQPLSAAELGACVGIGALVLASVETEKFIRRRRLGAPRDVCRYRGDGAR